MTDTLSGPAGNARRCILPSHRDTPDQDATLDAWLIEAPGQSPAWSHYLLSIIHLRPIPGVRPPIIKVPGATHEMIIVALDPTRNPVYDDFRTWAHLTPINAMCQFIVDTDDQAIRLGVGSVRAIVAGYSPAEPPFPEAGQRYWQDLVMRSAEHIRTGFHASDSVTRN